MKEYILRLTQTQLEFLSNFLESSNSVTSKAIRKKIDNIIYLETNKTLPNYKDLSKQFIK